MILKEYETNFIIDFDRTMLNYIFPYDKEVCLYINKNLNNIQSKLVLLLNTSILDIYEINFIVKEIIKSINTLEELIICNELEYFEDDLRELLFNKLTEFEELEEYEICSNIKRFLNNF